MRGELIAVWPETWRQIWLPLVDQPPGDNDEGVPEDIFCELYRELAKALKSSPSIEDLADIIDNSVQSREAFQNTTPDDLAGEPALIRFFEAAYEALEEMGGDELTNRYFNLLEAFIAKFSLRYDLRRPCILYPTLPGLVTSLVQHIRLTSHSDTHLAKLNHEFEEALRDLRLGRTEGRIKACLTKQYILIEGIANARSGTNSETLGQRCNAASWPHPTLKAAAGNIYGFRSDYPGLGHAGNPNAVLREVDDRELAGVLCMLLGIVPYIDSTVNLGSLYGPQASPFSVDRGNGGASLTRQQGTSPLKRIQAGIKRLLGGRG
jgi:hypothetical protein